MRSLLIILYLCFILAPKAIAGGNIPLLFIPARLAPFTWTGLSGDHNWNTAGNWSTGAVPGATNIARFNGAACAGTNCDVTINVSISIAGIVANTSYGGTITQSANQTINVGSAGWNQATGNFTGSNANITLTGSVFSFTSSGNFTSTSGTFEVYNYKTPVNATIFTIGSSAIFSPNGGTFKFSDVSEWSTHTTHTIDVPNLTPFNNLILHQAFALDSNSISYSPVSGRTIVVTGDLTHGASQFSAAQGMTKLNGLWQVQGNYIVGTEAAGGTGNVTLNGSGAQVITADATAFTADLTVNKSAGSVTMNAGSTTLRTRRFFLDQGTFTAPSGTLDIYGYSSATNDTIFGIASGTTFNLNNGTVKFDSYAGWGTNPTYSIDVPDLFQFNHVILHQWAAKNTNSVGYAPVGVRTIVVTGDLTHGASQFSAAQGMTKLNGLWQVQGNYIVGTEAAGGTGNVTLNGSGAQVITADATAFTADLTVNKSGGSVTMNAGSTTLRTRRFFLDQGTFTAPSGTLDIYGYSSATNDTIFRIASGTTFNLNSGTVKFDSYAAWGANPTYLIDVPDLFQFNHVILHQWAAKNSNSIGYAPVGVRTIVVTGDLTHGAGEFSTANGASKIAGAWQVQGNYSIGADAFGGTGSLVLNGTGAQSISTSTGTPASGIVTINKSSGIASLTTNFSINAANQDLLISAGTLDMAGFNLTVNRNINNSGTLKRGNNPTCGTVSQGGTFTGNAAICP